MIKTEKIFTIAEVERLVKNAYEVGYCDGLDISDSNSVMYRDSDDFWNKNHKQWLSGEIGYISQGADTF